MPDIPHPPAPLDEYHIVHFLPGTHDVLVTSLQLRPRQSGRVHSGCWSLLHLLSLSLRKVEFLRKVLHELVLSRLEVDVQLGDVGGDASSRHYVVL